MTKASGCWALMAFLASGCVAIDDSANVQVEVSPHSGAAPLNVSLQVSSTDYEGKAEWEVMAAPVGDSCRSDGIVIARGDALPASSWALLQRGEWQICVAATVPGYYGSGGPPPVAVSVE